MEAYICYVKVSVAVTSAVYVKKGLVQWLTDYIFDQGLTDELFYRWLIKRLIDWLNEWLND